RMAPCARRGRARRRGARTGRRVRGPRLLGTLRLAGAAPARSRAVPARGRAHDRGAPRRGARQARRLSARESDGPRPRYELPDPGLEAARVEVLARFQERYGERRSPEAVRQMVVTVLRFVTDGTSSPDLRLLSNALKALRHAFRLIAPWAHV